MRAIKREIKIGMVIKIGTSPGSREILFVTSHWNANAINIRLIIVIIIKNK